MFVVIDWDHESVVGYCGGEDVAKDIKEEWCDKRGYGKTVDGNDDPRFRVTIEEL